MNYYRLCLIASFILLPVCLSAQVYTTGTQSKKADVNFTDLANYYKAHPLPLVRKQPFDEDDEQERTEQAEPDASLVHLINRAARGVPGGGPAYLPASPAPDDTFLSTLSDGTDIPPDTHGAVDSQYCITAINTSIHIQTRTGGEVSNIGLDGFWSAVLPAGTGSFDPRVHYDPYNKRWIIISDAVASGTMTNSTLLIAVSVTNDPTGSWHQYAAPVDPTGASWLDFPCIGFNQRWLTITGNMFPNTAAGVSGAAVYVFNYADILAGTSAPYTQISEGSSFTLCPALTYDPTEPNMFLMEVSNAGMGKLQLWKLTGPVGSPVIASVGYPTSTQHWHNGGSTDFVPQVGSAHLIQAGDDRITCLTYRNQHLWCSHTVFLPDPGTVSRCSVMWWEIDTLANPLQNGLIDDPVTPTFFDYSSITVNANDDALLGFGYLSAAIHPSGAYALHMHTDPADSMRLTHVFRHGQATYYETFSGTQNRWGDYSGTCVDPRNDLDFWTIQESSFVGSSPNWDTWWANVKLCPTPAAPPLTVSPAAPCIGDTATYAIAPIPGATSYQWIVTGTGWSGASTGTSIIVTAGTGAGTVVVLAYNACGEGESNTFTLTPPVLPATPAISVYSPACIGTPTAVFSATSTGATAYSWEALGTGWSGTSTATSLTATVGTGPGLIICTTSNACGSSPADTLVVTAAAVPATSFTIAAHALNTLTNDVITFTGSAPTGSAYTWNFGGGTGTPGTGAGPQTVQWTTGGTKTVTLTVSNNGCTSTFTDTVNVRDATGVQQINTGKFNVNIIPNPNDGSFDIMFDQPVDKAITIKLMDMQGRLVYSNEFSGTNNNQVSVETNRLPAGVYVVNMNIDGEKITQKITIVR